MKKILLAFSLIISLIAPINAHAAVKAGASCKKAGQITTIAGKKFTCVKSGKKLVWNKGVAVVTTNPVAPAAPVIDQLNQNMVKAAQKTLKMSLGMTMHTS